MKFNKKFCAGISALVLTTTIFGGNVFAARGTIYDATTQEKYSSDSLSNSAIFKKLFNAVKAGDEIIYEFEDNTFINYANMRKKIAVAAVTAKKAGTSVAVAAGKAYAADIKVNDVVPADTSKHNYTAFTDAQQQSIAVAVATQAAIIPQFKAITIASLPSTITGVTKFALVNGTTVDTTTTGTIGGTVDTDGALITVLPSSTTTIDIALLDANGIIVKTLKNVQVSNDINTPTNATINVQ